MRKQATAEQKARAAERRAQFRKMVKQVADMSDVQRAALTNKIGAIVTCEGSTLSLHNTLLVLLQNSQASLVGGFRQWIKAGRCVRKGEHGMMIWVPIGAPKQNDGETPAATEEGEGVHFLIGTVFDVSQTQEIETLSEPAPVDQLQAA